MFGVEAERLGAGVGRAMSHTLEITRRGFGVFNAFMRGELSSQAYADAFDPQLELVWQDRQAYPDFPHHLRGVAECVAFSEQYRDLWIDLAQEPLELIQVPNDRVLVLVHQTARGRQSGVPIAIHFFELVMIRDGRVCRIEYFRHRADALAAAGVRS